MRESQARKSLKPAAFAAEPHRKLNGPRALVLAAHPFAQPPPGACR
jgi:hypothetical protein